MLTIEGTYKNGKIVLNVPASELSESKVLMTFLQPVGIDLGEREIDKEQATRLRAKLDTIAEDWNRPEMDVYDVD